MFLYWGGPRGFDPRQGPGGGDGWLANGRPAGRVRQPGRWVQYQLALGAVNGGNSPRVRSVRVEWE